MKANSVIKSLLLVSLLTMAPAEGHANEKEENNDNKSQVEYVQVQSGLNVRQEPGTVNEKIDALPIGSKLEVLETKTIDSNDKYKEWNKVKTEDGKLGWVSADYTDSNAPQVRMKSVEKSAVESNTDSKPSVPEKETQVEEQVSSSAMTMRVSFYGDFAHENGGYAGTDAQGNRLVSGTVASNVYPFGTQFEINGQTFTVRDRGGSHFNSSDRLDIFVPRQSGENDSEYANRISRLGRQTVTAYKK